MKMPIDTPFSGVWKHCICTNHHDMNSRGNLPCILQNFFIDRSITVCVSLSTQLKLIFLKKEYFKPQHFFNNNITTYINCVHFFLILRLFADNHSVSFIRKSLVQPTPIIVIWMIQVTQQPDTLLPSHTTFPLVPDFNNHLLSLLFLLWNKHQ